MSLRIHKNQTKNHHFIPRVDLRANKISQSRSSGGRIFEYPVLDRESFTVGPAVEREIRMIGCAKHLYRVALLDGKSSINLEALFAHYEHAASQAVTSLLSALESGSALNAGVVLAVLRHKLLGFFRNPYNICKTLNSLAGIEQRILNGETAHQLAAYVDRLGDDEIKCNAERYSVGLSEYRRWLSRVDPVV